LKVTAKRFFIQGSNFLDNIPRTLVVLASTNLLMNEKQEGIMVYEEAI
jgi:hypothetical protein